MTFYVASPPPTTNFVYSLSWTSGSASELHLRRA